MPTGWRAGEQGGGHVAQLDPPDLAGGGGGVGVGEYHFPGALERGQPLAAELDQLVSVAVGPGRG